MSDTLRYSIDAIYHPTDFTLASRTAFEHALRIAIANRSSLDIIHSGGDTGDQPVWQDYPEVRKTLVRWGYLTENSRPEDIETELGISVRKVQVDGTDPSEGVAAFLSDKQSGLLVLATEARMGLPRWLRPSVSGGIAQRAMPDSLARDSAIAALFVPSGVAGFVSSETGEIDLDRILVPVAKQPDPQSAIDTTAALLHSLSAEPLWVEALHIGEEGDGPRLFPPAGLEECFMRATRPGNPVDEIVGAAGRGDSDLIVMATAGRQGFLDALRGSTAEQVVRRAPCPVLAVPAD